MMTSLLLWQNNDYVIMCFWAYGSHKFHFTWVEASSFTQVPLQHCCVELRLKPHPLSSKLSIVTVLASTDHKKSRNGGPTCQEDFSKPIRTKEERNGPPSANQGLSTTKPRNSHSIWSQCWYLSILPCPTLSAATQPKSQGYCQKWHHKLKFVGCI